MTGRHGCKMIMLIIIIPIQYYYTADTVTGHTARGDRARAGGTCTLLGAAAELVAPLGCVTGSARYLFLIRPGPTATTTAAAAAVRYLGEV